MSETGGNGAAISAEVIAVGSAESATSSGVPKAILGASGVSLMASVECQDSISRWADETFGPAGSNARAAARANEEMAELLKALTADDNHPKAAEEIADVYIVLCRVATRLGVRILDEVDRKMAINRAREWKKDGTGHGYHVKAAGE